MKSTLATIAVVLHCFFALTLAGDIDEGNVETTFWHCSDNKDVLTDAQFKKFADIVFESKGPGAVTLNQWFAKFKDPSLGTVNLAQVKVLCKSYSDQLGQLWQKREAPLNVPKAFGTAVPLVM